MLKRITISVLAGLALALAAPGAHAQAKAPAKPAAKAPAKPAPAPAAQTSSGGIGQGDTELNFFGQLSDQDAFGTLLTLGVSYGSYLSDNVELKITQVMVYADADALSLFSYIPYVTAEYQFRPDPGSPLVFYAGGGGGINLTTIDAGGFDVFTYSLFLTPTAGLKYFLNERMSLTYSLSYQFPLVEETCDSVDCYSSDTTTLQNFLGFSIYY